MDNIKLIVVSRDDFYSYINPRDIVLSSFPERTDWRTRSYTLVGRSIPGYLDPGKPETYMLTKDAYTTLN